MRCLLPSVNFKVLGKAVLTLSKIGDELYIEPHKDGINLLTVNSGRSAFATFTFTQNFFSFYDVDGTMADITGQPCSTILSNTHNGENLKCKLAMKSVLAVFRTPSNNVETCQILLEPDSTQLIFQLRCRHSIRKIHYVPVIESETVQAVYNKDNVPNKFCAQSRVLTDVLQNFQKNHEEISITVNPNQFFFRNYTDGSSDSRRAVVRTEVGLEPLEFDFLIVGVDTSVTFSLHELRALLLFSEATSLPVTAYFETAGRPIIFSISSSPSFEAHFVLATISQQLNDSQANTSQASTASMRHQTRPQNRPASSSNRDADDTSICGEIAEVNTGDQEMEAAEENMDADFAAHQKISQTNIQETPPWLRAQKFFYPRCFMDPNKPPSPEVHKVLCPDSDPEDIM